MTLEKELYWLALTVWMEARGESFLGQLAVAWVIMNRKQNNSVADTVLRKLQFSCWNADSVTRANVDIAEIDLAWTDCFKAAAAAYFQLLPDPTNAATHYLNPKSLKVLPKWYSPGQVVKQIGNHDFLRVA